MVKRLPVYILADTSGSMQGDPIEAVKQGIRLLHSNLMEDPMAIEVACLSVIAFDENARQLVPLTEVLSFNPPEIEATGRTALGAALKLLIECIRKEVRRSTPERKGDWKPLIFLLTDGEPTDEWEAAAEELRNSHPGNVVGVACGGNANVTVLKKIADSVLLMKEATPHAFAEFFKWVSASVSAYSRTGVPEDTRSSAFPPPPPELPALL